MAVHELEGTPTPTGRTNDPPPLHFAPTDGVMKRGREAPRPHEAVTWRRLQWTVERRDTESLAVDASSDAGPNDTTSMPVVGLAPTFVPSPPPPVRPVVLRTERPSVVPAISGTPTLVPSLVPRVPVPSSSSLPRTPETPPLMVSNPPSDPILEEPTAEAPSSTLPTLPPAKTSNPLTRQPIVGSTALPDQASSTRTISTANDRDSYARLMVSLIVLGLVVIAILAIVGVYMERQRRLQRRPHETPHEVAYYCGEFDDLEDEDDDPAAYGIDLDSDRTPRAYL